MWTEAVRLSRLMEWATPLGTGRGKVQFANVPPGMRVGAKASGLFKSVELDRGPSMSDPVSS
jgi:hypothetical protein